MVLDGDWRVNGSDIILEPVLYALLHALADLFAVRVDLFSGSFFTAYQKYTAFCVQKGYNLLHHDHGHVLNFG